MKENFNELLLKEQTAYNAYISLFDEIMNAYFEDKNSIPKYILDLFTENTTKINKLRQILIDVFENELERKEGD